VRLVNSTN